MKKTILIIAAVVFASSISTAEIIVPEGFVFERLLDQIDGYTQRLETISNPANGVGIVSAFMDIPLNYTQFKNCSRIRNGI